MRVYLDIIFLINFIFDFISILGTSIILKRNIKLIKIIIGSIIGEISVLSVFIRFNNIELIIFKIIISFLIILIVFNFKNMRYFFTNLYYFYLIELILGGLLYMFKNMFNYSMLIEILLGISFIYFFIKNIKKLKTNYNKYISVMLDINNNTYELNAFLDTGNKLRDPYLNNPIIILDNTKYKLNGDILVPFSTCNYNGILKCIKGSNLYVNGIKINKKFLVGLSNNINIDGVDCIFNEDLMEEL